MPNDVSAHDRLSSDTDPAPASGGTDGGSFFQKIVVSAIIGLLAVAVIFLLARYKKQGADLLEQTQLRESAELRAQEQAGEISAQQSRLAAVEVELQNIQTSHGRLETDLSGVRAENLRLSGQLEASEARNRDLADRLAEEKAALAEARTKLDEEREGQKVLFSKIERLMQERESLKEKLAQTSRSGSIEMPQMLVTQQEPSGSGVVGAVLAVNGEYDFIVISLGREDGIKPGDRFRIVDHGDVVGEVVARRVLDRMTVADIETSQTTRKVRKNFKVILDG
ncbi:MAG TPA: hypothetical protein PK636_02415 [bacterium]|nr:hypothetical protein [bacterium]HPJ71519.1 hypothetical protein [bacterium]HPQ66197.1 hypothetical protein [bacterium]